MGDTALGYDANGNTLVECHAGPSEVCAGTPGTTGAVSTAKLRRFAWNEENWLKAVVDGGGQNVTRFLYDAGGERVVKMGQSGVSITVGQFFAVKNGIYATKHIFAGETRLVSKLEPLRRNVEPDDDGTPGEVQDLPGCEPSDYTPRKCYAPIVGVAADGSSSPANFRPMTYYYHPDHLGSTSWLTDQFGEVQERVEYYPYGEVWREDREQRRGNLRRIQQLLFTSKEFDEETGLTYFGARYYNSGKARWLSTDPAGPWRSPTAANLFQYGLWNPIRLIDPDGLAEACPPNSICAVGRFEGGVNDVRAFSRGFFGVSSEPTIRLPGFHEGGRLRCNKATCWTEFTASQPPPLKLQVLAKDNPIEEAGKEVRLAVDALTLPLAGVSLAKSLPAAAARGITSGSQVTDDVIRQAMKGAPLQSQQAGGVSLPKVQGYVDDLLAGKPPPPIKVDGNMIVDGNHRYIAGQVLGQPPPIQPWAGGRPESAVPWETIPIDPKAWP